MTDQQIRDLVESMLAVSIDTADRDELGVAAGLNAKLKAFTAHYDMRLSRRADLLSRAGASERGFNLLVNECGSGRDAKHAEDRERVCNDLPEFEAALADGAVSAEHVDVLAKHTKGLTDQERSELQADVEGLVDAAVRDSASLFDRDVKNLIADIKARTRPDTDVEQLERQRAASSVKRWTDQATGMKMTLIALDPLRDTTLHAVVNAQLERLRQDPANASKSFEQLKVEAVLASVSADAGEFGLPEIVFHVDAKTACEGRHAHSLCETVDGDAVPVATMQRFCCEAVLTAVIIEVDGTARNLVEQRTANRQQRRALSAMYATCAHPHCTVPFSRCRMHHVIWWSNGGATTIGNMLALCETHHHLVHEGGWTITMTPEREVTWMRPDGTVWLVHQSVNRQPELRQRRQRQQRQQRPEPAAA